MQGLNFTLHLPLLRNCEKASVTSPDICIQR
jgi:hypothetical protein